MANTPCVIGLGKLRKVALSYFHDVVLNLYNIKIKMESRDKKFKSERELPAFAAVDFETAKSQMCQRVKIVFPDNEEQVEAFMKICSGIIGHTDVKNLLADVADTSKLAAKTVKEWGVEKENYIGVVPTDNGHASIFETTIDDEMNRLYLHWDTEKLSGHFMTAVSRLAQYLRDNSRQPTSNEYLAFQIAYYGLSEGKIGPQENARCLGTPGFRPHTQTYMSLTDPGDGHVLGTTRFNDWMKGAIVHVEHLERPRHLSREHIESYRIPSMFDFSKVRLHVGTAAPTTYFVGRPVKDSGHFNQDFLKIVNITAAAASAAFFQGAAECKVSMEGLTTSQAVRYMQALRGHVQKKRKQALSAAWNLNQTITDDYCHEEGVLLKQRIEIATRAIEITSIGGFNKVTWDGASDTYPSKCIMYQLSFEEALTIVHEAHMRGLVTYFSAGFKFNEIKYAVYAGVDGIGIGGAQVLRFMDSETGMHGPYTEENIPRIMASRDEAAQSARGRGVQLLARLDSMFFEGSINKRQNELRIKLFNSLLAIDVDRVEKLIEELDDVTSLPDEGNYPLIATAKRLMEVDEPLLKQQCESEKEWGLFLKQVKSSVLAKDSESLDEEYHSDPWLSLRRRYRKEQMENHKCITRQSSFDVNCKSFN